MTNVEEIIQNRRSVRKFNDIPLSDEALSAIVEAGRLPLETMTGLIRANRERG